MCCIYLFLGLIRGRLPLVTGEKVGNSGIVKNGLIGEKKLADNSKLKASPVN